MATYNILVPAGIGDFSWLWSKLSTTGDSYHIEYAKANPDRLGPFLALLPKDKVLSYRTSDHTCFFNAHTLEMKFQPEETLRRQYYGDMRKNELNHIEPNTHLERGGRIESWMPDIPACDFHYKIEGLLDNPVKEDFFIVHLSSTHTFKIWKHYDVNTWVDLVDMIHRNTGWRPVFIGGAYDDFARQVYDTYALKFPADNLIGKTPDLLPALHLVQTCRFFLGAVSSGMTMLANVLKVPSASWWPREKLPQSWNAPDVPYLWMMWKNPEEDKTRIQEWLKTI